MLASFWWAVRLYLKTSQWGVITLHHFVRRVRAIQTTHKLQSIKRDRCNAFTIRHLQYTIFTRIKCGADCVLWVVCADSFLLRYIYCERLKANENIWWYFFLSHTQSKYQLKYMHISLNTFSLTQKLFSHMSVPRR